MTVKLTFSVLVGVLGRKRFVIVFYIGCSFQIFRICEFFAAMQKLTSITTNLENINRMYIFSTTSYEAGGYADIYESKG